MPKKIKLTPEQQEQEAAIRETESFFNNKNNQKKEVKKLEISETKKANSENSKPEAEKLEAKDDKNKYKKKIFGKSITVKKNSAGSSPYLVDLAVSRRKESQEKEDQIRQKEEAHSSMLRGGQRKNKFLSFFNFSKKKEEKYSADLASHGNFLKFRASPSKALKAVETIDAAIRKIFIIAGENIRSLSIPTIKTEKKIKNFYRQREDVLGELLAVNVLMLAVSGIKKIVKFIFFAVSFFIKDVYELLILFLKLVAGMLNIFFIIGKLLFCLARKANNLFLNSSKKSGAKTLSAAKSASLAGIALLEKNKKSAVIFFKEISLLSKRLFFYAIYPFKAFYSNVKKFFQLAKNETEAALSNAKEAASAQAKSLKKRAEEAGEKIKTGIIKKIFDSIAKFFENTGRATSVFFKFFVSFFTLIANWIKSFFNFKFLPPMAWPKQLAVFIALGLIIIFPLKVFGYLDIFKEIKGQVLGESERAMSSLQQAAEASGEFNFLGAASHFSQAADNFNRAQSALSEYSNLISIANIIPAKKAKLAATGQNLIVSGKVASEIGEYLTLAVNSLELDNPEKNGPLTERLKEFSRYINLVNEKLLEFEDSIGQVDPDVISSLNIENQQQIIEQLKSLKSQTEIFRKGMNEMLALSDILPEFLGDKADKRYLLIFQNNAEMRASGGFIGSYALVDFRQGEIKKLEIPGGGSYDLQGGLHKRISAPEPMHLINSLWEFQDSNWWPDWPSSAQKIQWFFENGWGSSVDGVIAIDTTFAEKLLEIIGPVDMQEKYGEIITSENFYNIVQSQSERKDTDTPKEIITDLVNKLIEELPSRVTSDNLFSIIKDMEQLFLEKHILLNFNDPALQDFVADHNWEGEIKDTSSDYLSVINTNIAGGKSDRVINQAVEHTAEIMPDGSIIDTVIITRRHNGIKGEDFTGVRNVNYIRVYVPRGSQLLEASGFSEPDEIFFDEPAEGTEIDPDIYLTENIAKVDELSGVKIYSEFNKTVFGHWTQVDPGETINIRFKYKLPFKINSISQHNNFWSSLFKGDEIINAYSLLAQKQPGSIETVFWSELILPDNMEMEWATDQDIISDQGWQIQDNLRQDKVWGALIKKTN